MRSKFNKKRVILVIIVVLLLLLIGTIGTYYLINNKKGPIEHLVYDEFDTIGGKINDNTYYIFGAKKDIAFEIIKQNDFSYEMVNKNGDKINSQLVDDMIKAPDEMYEEGMTYYLKIKNGNFKDNKYKDVNEIIFNVARSAKQMLIVKENDLKVNLKDIRINDNSIKINGDYKENDIIVVYNDDKLIGAYKIGKEITTNEYEYSIPKINEVFSDIDYYGKERINLANYVNDKNFNLFLNSLVHTVYAKEDVTINKPVWNKKDGTLEVGITIYTNNRKDFLANHDAKIELTLVLSIDLYKDITLDNYDYALEVNYNIKINNSFNHINDNFSNLYDAIKNKNNVEGYDTKWLEDGYSKLEFDKKQLEKSFGKITVDTKIEGLYLDIDNGILIDISNKGFINNTLSGNNTLLIGISESNGVYSNYSFDNKGEVNLVGDSDNKIASIIEAKLSFINIFDMDIRMTSGMYSSYKSSMNINNEDDLQTKIDYEIKGEDGFFAKYLVDTTEGELKTIYDDKIALNKIDRNIKILGKKKEEKKEEEKKDDNKTNYKYSADKVRELLQNGYNALDEYEEWDMPMGTLTTHFISKKEIDVDSNTFTETRNYDDMVSYTCTYNYVTKEMKCSNFEDVQNYVKGTCDNMHNDYLNYLETGEINNEDAKEWDNLYSDITACYYEAIPSSEPTDYDDDIQSILDQVKLTFDDLGVLKN